MFTMLLKSRSRDSAGIKNLNLPFHKLRPKKGLQYIGAEGFELKVITLSVARTAKKKKKRILSVFPPPITII